MNVERLYLDYNATSPLSHSVLDWLRSGDLLFANPASQHTSGKASRKLINETRAQIFSTFSKNEKDTTLFFHSGATEGFSTFAYSFSEWARVSKRKLLICYSQLDHPAVTSLSERYFGEHTNFFELKIDQNLEYDHAHNLKSIQACKSADPQLIILYHHLWVHNETGVVAELDELKPFKEISDLFVHVDAVQAPGKIPNWKDLMVGDIFTFSPHKFGALKGLGFSFFPKSMPFYPLITGGSQQIARSGTENALGIKSIALALKDLELVNVAENIKNRIALEVFLQAQLVGLGEVISTKGRVHNSNTIYFYLNQLSSDIALALFDLSGLMISAGSACSSGAARPSALLRHLGLDLVAKNGLRLSFAFALSGEELELIKARLKVVIDKLR